VFYSNMQDYLNMTSPVEITDFLLTVMGALAEEVQQQFGETPAHEGIWTRFANLIKKEVTIEELGFENAGFSLKAALRDDPSFKRKLQEHTRGHAARLIREAQEFAAEVVDLVRSKRKNEDQKVVFLVDSLERLRGVGADGARAVHESVENLFSGPADALHLPPLHVVYTVPPWLPALAKNLGAALGSVSMLSSLHIYADRDGTPDKRCAEFLELVIDHRERAWRDILTPEQLHTLMMATGGDFRDFFLLIQDCLTRAGASNAPWPLEARIIEAAIQGLRRTLLPISEEDREWLRAVAETHDVAHKNDGALPTLARFFDSKLVLNYRNGEDWYDVHPLIRDVVAGE
jgi:hypothetical protein